MTARNKDLDEENPSTSTRVAADNNNRWMSCVISTRFLTTFIFIILAAVGFVVGVAWSAISPASSKTINVSSKQVAVVATDPIDNYVLFDGDGVCLDKEGEKYPDVFFTVSDPDECAVKCQCAQGIKGVTLRGFTYDEGPVGRINYFCNCHVDWLNPQKTKDQKKIAKLNEKCDAAGSSAVYFDGLYGAVTFSSTDETACLNYCIQCTDNVARVERAASGFDTTNNVCQCNVKWLNPATTEQSVIDALTTSCGGNYDVLYDTLSGIRNGSGKVKSTDGSTAAGDCYEFKGSNKSSKATKSPKRERD